MNKALSLWHSERWTATAVQDHCYHTHTDGEDKWGNNQNLHEEKLQPPGWGQQSLVATESRVVMLLASAPNRLKSPNLPSAHVGAHSGSHHGRPSVLLTQRFGKIFYFLSHVFWGFCLVAVVALFLCVFFLSALVCLGRLVKFKRDKVQYLGTKPQRHCLYFQHSTENGFDAYIGNLLTF